jgi:cytochrome b6-f complex iron-sulfur subunit
MPRKKEESKAETPAPPRRKFIEKLWWLLGGLALAETAWVVSDFFSPRRQRKARAEGRSIIVAGPVDRFEPGSVTPFPEGKFYLVRLDDGGFLALSRQCTHLGCTVPWVEEENRFLCPCHTSAFNIKGEVMSPPAPRPLNYFAVRIENSIVKVNISQSIERTAFSKDQAVRL